MLTTSPDLDRSFHNGVEWRDGSCLPCPSRSHRHGGCDRSSRKLAGLWMPTMAGDPVVDAQELAKGDPVIGTLVDQFGLPEFPQPTEQPFATLVRAITQQQIASAAARAIHGRLVAALRGQVTPERLAATPAEALRAAGLSANK